MMILFDMDSFILSLSRGAVHIVEATMNVQLMACLSTPRFSSHF